MFGKMMKNLWYLSCTLLWAIILVLILCAAIGTEQEEDIPHLDVENWALKFGIQIQTIGKKATRVVEIEKRLKDANDVTVVKVDGYTTIKEMAKDVRNMMQFKMHAIKRIMDSAETLALSHPEPETEEDRQKVKAEFVRAKPSILPLVGDEVNEEEEPDEKYMADLPVVRTDPHFNNLSVNTDFSVVHIPTNVYDGDPDVVMPIKWSENLNQIFVNNYKLDPSLSWQYFGSASGFMRQYPASVWEWRKDLYDCRMRSWYVQAAASPKDIVMLLDISGSMTGQRKDIGKHVAHTILDTLTDNDYVNIYTFAGETMPLVPCFKDTLVQANLENVREFKNATQGIITENIANFTEALIKAFEVLHKFREGDQGAQCNQAIMLITDGAPYNFKEIFEQYNWKNIGEDHRIRIFTYLIGREVTDDRDVLWMACANKGYFVHVATQAEVQEQVMKYIPVMARPLVMYRDHHPIIWTQVYADIVEAKATEWNWEKLERLRQQERTERYREVLRKYQSSVNHPVYNKWEVDKFLTYGEWMLTEREMYMISKTKERVNEGEASTTTPTSKTPVFHARVSERKYKFRSKPKKSKNRIQKKDKYAGYTLMTSVATPVFDRRNVSVSRDKERIAKLLGVAGTDVPLKEILKLTPQYKLGVNGYSFAVTNNGYILFHPDLRPVFQDILKPNYNAVDLAEVELVESTEGPRSNDTALYNLRRDMIDQKQGETELNVTIHYDDLKRVTTRRQKYYYHPIEDTPFSLGIALPDVYGHYRLKADIEIALTETNVLKYFEGKKWKVHPEWVYCEYNYPIHHPMSTNEEKVLHFLARAQKQKWSWRSERVRSPPKEREYAYKEYEAIYKEYENDSYYCDKELLQSLVFDAMITNGFDRSDHSYDKAEGVDFFHMFGITLAFVSTRSGLTRWQDIASLEGRESNITEEDFSEVHTHSVDEVWYRRAVEQHQWDRESFVVSVPFDAGTKNSSVVTLTRAVFYQHHGNSAPAAVVGIQMNHANFADTFFNITSKCTNNMGECKKTCASESLKCFVLDSNGFVVISEQHENTGRFFGEIDGTIMDSLVQDGIYKRVQVYDYQAVCLGAPYKKSDASFLLTPFKHLAWIFRWILGKFIWMLIQTNLHELWNPDWASATSSTEDGGWPETVESTVSSAYPDDYDGQTGLGPEGAAFPYLDLAYINKTRPLPCDKEVALYILQPQRLQQHGERSPLKGKLTNCHISGCERPFSVGRIPYSNLVLLVADNLCLCQSKTLSITPRAVVYDDAQFCNKMTSTVYRRRPPGCCNYHPNESEVKDCGRGDQITVSVTLLSSLVLLVLTRLRLFS